MGRAIRNRRRLGVAGLLMASAAAAVLAQNAPPAAPAFTLSGTYTLSGKSDKLAATTCKSDTQDVSAIYVQGGGSLNMTGVTVTTSGATSSEDNSTFYGLNAAVLSVKGSKIKITAGSVSTTGSGASGIFATGIGAGIDATKTLISSTGEAARGAMASAGGSITLHEVTITTTGDQSPAIATDRGGGTITVTKGTATTSGDRSPAIYSTGVIKVIGASLIASGAEGAIIDGKSSLTLTDTDLAGKRSRGLMIYQSVSVAGGDDKTIRGQFVMKGGSLTAAEGPLIYVTNTTASVQLADAALNAASGTLIDASAGDWGKAGSNGGHLQVTTDHETLNGNITADAISTVAIKLQADTVLNGSIQNAAVMLDNSSKWNVSATSVVTTLLDASCINGNQVSNITGNGFDVHYDASQPGNKYLAARIYNLASGGHLIPDKINSIAANTTPNGNNPNGTSPTNPGNNGGGGGFGGGGRGGGGRRGR